MDSPDWLGMAQRVSLVLALVIALILLLAFLARNFLKSKGLGFTSSNLLRVVATRYMGGRKSLVLMDVAGEYVLIGLSGDRVNYLTKIDGKEAVRRIEQSMGKNDYSPGESTAEGEQPEGSQGFRDKLKAALKQNIRHRG